MPNAYVINQNKSTLSPRVDCGLPSKHSYTYQNPWNFRWKYTIFHKLIESQITVWNKLNQNKMRWLNIYDKFYLFMWFQIVWMCVIDMLNAPFLSPSPSSIWSSIATQKEGKKTKTELCMGECGSNAGYGVERESVCERESWMVIEKIDIRLPKTTVSIIILMVIDNGNAYQAQWSNAAFR